MNVEKTDLVTFETVDTMSLKSGVEDRRILQSDRGHIPLVDETDVVHIYEEQIESRKKKIQNCRERMEKLDSVDYQKRREVENSLIEISESTIFRLHDSDFRQGSLGDVVSELVGFSMYDDRMNAVCLYGFQAENVTNIRRLPNGIALDVDDEQYETSDNYIEIASVGDVITVQGRCVEDGQNICRSFVDEFVQMNEAVDRVSEMVEKQAWGMFNTH